VSKNPDNWIEEQIAAQGLEDTAEVRRQLRMDYYDLNPYDKKETVARTSPTNVGTEKDVFAQGGQTNADGDIATVKKELSQAESQLNISQNVGPYEGTAYVFPSRKINYTANNIKQAAYSKTGRIHNLSGVGGVSGTTSYYDGDLLVNAAGDIERGQYDVTGRDILGEYSSITNPVERSEFFSTLKNYDFYGDGKPSALALAGRGLTSTDENAIQKFLNYSSGQGKTWRTVMPLLQGQVKSNGGGGRAVSVVSTEDATRVFREESLRLLGRMPTQQEIRAAVGAIQSRERSRGAGGSMDAPSLSTAAQEQARRTAPGEAAAQAAGQAMNQIFALLGGR
jgi:hypothetical protein